MVAVEDASISIYEHISEISSVAFDDNHLISRLDACMSSFVLVMRYALYGSL